MLINRLQDRIKDVSKEGDTKRLDLLKNVLDDIMGISKDVKSDIYTRAIVDFN